MSLGRDRDDRLFYRNNFTAIPASVQFRAELATDRPKVSGTLNAKVDAAASGKYAELDSQGRYKVILPFDLSGRKDGHASAWLRMAQPYAGENFGMHMPLHKGCEVLLSFVGGDPDRPVIASAVPNPETASPVSDKNQTQACLTSSGGNRIHMEDEEGNQRILLSSPTQQSFIRIGSHNDPDDEAPTYKFDTQVTSDNLENWEWAESPDGLKLFSAGPLTVKVAESVETVLGNKNEITLGALTDNVIGERLITTFLLFQEIDLTRHVRYGPEIHELKGSVKEDIATKQQNIANLMDMMVSHTQTLGELKQTVADHSQTVGELSAMVASHTTTIGRNSRTIAQHTQRIAEQKDTVARHTKTIGEHTVKIAQHNREIAESWRTIGRQSEKVMDLKQNVGTATRTSATETTTSSEVTYLAAALSVV